MFAAPERAVLRPLATFAGAFALLSAQAVAATSDIDLARFADIIVNLVAKMSLATPGAARLYVTGFLRSCATVSVSSTKPERERCSRGAIPNIIVRYL
jgi:predicted ATPase